MSTTHPAPYVRLGADPHKNFLAFAMMVGAYAMSLCKEHFPGTGLYFLVATPLEWAALPVNQTFDVHGVHIIAPIPIITIPAQLPAIVSPDFNMAVFVYRQKRITAIFQAIESLKSFCLDAMDEAVRTSLQDPTTGHLHTTVTELMQGIRIQFGTPTSATIAGLKIELVAPMSPGDTFLAKAAKDKAIHVQLLRYEQPLSEFDKMEALSQACFNNQHVSTLIERYIQDVPEIGTRNFKDLCTYVSRRLPNLTVTTKVSGDASIITATEAALREEAGFQRGLLARDSHSNGNNAKNNHNRNPVHLHSSNNAVVFSPSVATTKKNNKLHKQVLSSVIQPHPNQQQSLITTSSQYNTRATAGAATALADSGATDIMLRQSDSSVLSDVVPHQSMRVGLPNGETMQSVAIGTLHTPAADVQAFVFKNSDLNHSLLGLSALTNVGCKVELTSTDINVTHDGSTIYRGSKLPTDKLWSINLVDPSVDPCEGACNQAVRLETDAEFVAFVHASFGSPPVSTLIRAVRAGYLKGYPRITAEMISKNPPNSVATAKGYLDQTRQGQNSTKVQPPPVSPPSQPFSPPDDMSDDFVYCQLLPVSEYYNYSDLSGRFPVQSLTGNEYVLLSVYKGYIHLEPMRFKKKSEYVKGFQQTYDFFSTRSHNPRFQMIDNETSDDLENFFRQRTPPISLQYVAPNSHRVNRAERAMRPAKNHLIATLCTTAKDFPLKLWDTMLPQAEDTLNLLRKFTPDPTKSAYEGIHGHPYDFMRHPFAPFGMLVVVHNAPAVRGSWASHGEKAWYLGAAKSHYRAWRCFMLDTMAERISASLAWFPDTVYMPGSSKHEMVAAAIKDLSAALILLANSNATANNQQEPLRVLTASLVTSLKELSSLFVQPDAPLQSALLPVHEDTFMVPAGPATPALVQRVPAGAAAPSSSRQSVPAGAAAPLSASGSMVPAGAAAPRTVRRMPAGAAASPLDDDTPQLVALDDDSDDESSWPAQLVLSLFKGCPPLARPVRGRGPHPWRPSLHNNHGAVVLKLLQAVSLHSLVNLTQSTPLPVLLSPEHSQLVSIGNNSGQQINATSNSTVYQVMPTQR